MNLHLRPPKLAVDQQMSIEAFLAFTATRPNEERWELIEGVPVLNASPVDNHQVVASNVVTFLMVHKQREGASWLPMLGIGTLVPSSPNSLPQPDILVKAGPTTGRHYTDDALVIFEILSRSNKKADREWRRTVYSSVPNCQHYVTFSLKSPEAIVHNRADGWAEQRIKGLQKSVALPALDLAMPLAVVYGYTPLAATRIGAKPTR